MEFVHLDNGFGSPACDADARGSLLVDEPVSISCPVCLQRLAQALKERRASGGQTS